MGKSSKPILNHIPRFLDYCRREGLSDKTQENYKCYLNKFILWLKKENKTTLPPHKLTPRDIQSYRLYLSRYTDEKGRPLKKVTQKYYLIALRALLGYFTAKDVVSLPADKIALPKSTKAEKTVKFLNLEQIEKLLLAPNTKKPAGLRDRAILEALISTGLKVNQLRNLDRDQVEQILSSEALLWIKKYLETRKDKDKALFINYRSRRDAKKRLTPRSIERIVNYYGMKINLPFFITPEILRWARALALLNKEVVIQKPQTHKTLLTDDYNNKELSLFYLPKQGAVKTLSPTWHNVESNIKKEIVWLKNNIPVLPEKYKENPSFLRCDDCILRKIAILITSGEIKATEFKNNKAGEDLWNSITKKIDLKKISRHGEEWHKKMMDVIYEYFKSQNCKIILEPILNYGRADLGIYSKKPLYIEVETVSLFKLWYNLSTMKNVSFLIVPSENSAIEFKA